MIRQNRLKKWSIIFLIWWGTIAGTAYNTYVHFDFSHSTDSKSYVKMARGDYNVTLTHRYRFIIPEISGLVAEPLEYIYHKLWPHRPASEWPYQLAFYLVNSMVMAGAFTFLYAACLKTGLSEAASILGVISVATSRWANYAAGLPLTDSLYIFSIALGSWAIIQKSTPALLSALILGPLAKESFVFFIPVFFFFATNRKLAFAGTIAAGIIALSSRYIIDQATGAQAAESLSNATGHIENLSYSLKRIFAIRGLGELFTVIDFFTLIILIGLIPFRKFNVWKKDVPVFLWYFLPVVLIHALLSGDIARMLYYAFPLYAIVIGLIMDKIIFPYLRLKGFKST